MPENRVVQFSNLILPFPCLFAHLINSKGSEACFHCLFVYFHRETLLATPNVRRKQLNENHQRARFATDNRRILNSRQGIQRPARLSLRRQS